MLTLKQLIVVATRNFTPPHRASSLASKYPKLARPLSLRAVEAAFEAQKVYLSIQLRDPSIVGGAQSLKQFQSEWNNSEPSYATLTAFASQLSKVGLVINHVSPSRQVMIVSGIPQAMLGFPITEFQYDATTGIFQVATGTGMVLGGVAAVGGAILAPTPGSPGVVAAGVWAIGLGIATTSYGWYQLWKSDQPYEIPEVTIIGANPNDIPEVDIIGQLPDDLVPDDLLTLPPVDLDDLPPAQPPDDDDEADDDDDDEDDDFDV
jgi:hypothetical protein